MSDDDRTIRKGDQVVVLSGKDKGRRGAVLQVSTASSVLVENINMVEDATPKPNPQANQPGGIIEKEMPLHVSKVVLWNPPPRRATASASRRSTDGKQVRFFKSNGEVIDA